MRHSVLTRYIALAFLCLMVSSARQNLFAQGDSGFKFLEVKVVDPDGKPVADVEVDIKIDGMEFPMPTDDKGMISLNVPSQENTRVQLRAKNDEYLADTVSWQGGESIPESYTIKLQKGIPIGGLVHDEQGQPIEGVVVTGAMPHIAPGNITTLQVEQLATTDSEGRWQVQSKETPGQKLQFKLSHDDYIGHSSFGEKATWNQLKSLDHVLTLKKGIEFLGQITSPEGEPIVGATVFLGSSRYVSNEDKRKLTATTDQQGAFRFGNVKAGSTVVTVAVRGWAPELRTVQIKREMEPCDFQLEPGKTIRVLVTDADNVPVGGVGIAADEWRGHRSVPDVIYRGETDDQGIWECDSMPDDPMRFDLFKQGHMSSRNNFLSAGEQTHTIVLSWPLLVTGQVVDAESGLQLEKFNVAQGFSSGAGNSRIYWERYNVHKGADGKYKMEFSEPRDGYYVRIEAEGYRPQNSRLIRDDEGEVKINFEMEEGTGPSGKVLTPDGKPAVGADLLIATPNEGIYIYNGHAQQHEGRPTAKTDEQGRYQLPFADSNSTQVVCRHESGYAQISGAALEKTGDITLQAWASVEGTVVVGKVPLADEPVQLYFNHSYVQNAPQVYWNYSTQTDSAGKFKFDRVTGLEGTVARSVRFGDTGQGGFMSAYSHSQPVTLMPGQTVKVQLGGEGRSIKGQLKVPEGSTQDVHWMMASVQLTEQSQGRAAGGFFRALGQAIGELSGQPGSTPKPVHRRSYASAVDIEGNFAISDIAPGTYQLHVQLYSMPENEQYNWQPIGNLFQSVTIPEKNGESDQDPYDLGELTLKMITPPPAQNGATGLFLQAVPVEE